MDEYIFQDYVQDCTHVEEATTYLEILNCSDPECNINEEHPLEIVEFDNFLHRRGVFAPREAKEGVSLICGVRMVLQQNAQHKDTFKPHVLSLSTTQYTSMVEQMRLPTRHIESTSVVGPFFWCAMDQDDDDPHLQIIFRKSDVRKRGFTRGWELMLSHSFRTGITSGFAKGTASSEIVKAITHLRACGAQIAHPLLLPVIIISHDLSSKTDQKQRDTRDWLRHLENAVSDRDEIVEDDSYVKDAFINLDQINRDLVECHSQVLWKRPQAYLALIECMERGLRRFWDQAQKNQRYGGERGDVYRIHRNMVSRLEFYHAKLKGIQNYAHITLERLSLQRAALYNIIAQKESKLNLEMAGQQRRLAHASKRDSQSMKTLSLLGAIFLPATYLASVFSMTFFNFSPNGNNNAASRTNSNRINNDDDEEEPTVSSQLWIYFAITVPITLLVVVVWRWWDKRRERLYAKEDMDIEAGIDEMEAKIIKQTMRKRTMSKRERTFDLDLGKTGG